MVETRDASRRGFVVGSLSTLGALLTGCALERTGDATPAPVESGLPAGPADGQSPAPEGPVADGNEALRRLMAGNQRYVAGKPWALHEDVARRAEVAKGQHPFATVLTCVDSRVPPELVFDRGLGDLVVVRSAAGVLDHSVLSSLEFAVAELKTPLLMVLGHERCGAVDAAIHHKGASEGSIGYLVEELRPAIDRARKQPGDLLDQSVNANVQLVLGKLRKSPVLAELATHKKVVLVGARYDLDSGEVKLLG